VTAVTLKPVIELGITQSRSKLEPRLDVRRIEVAIVDEQPVVISIDPVCRVRFEE
jgi:hypothetical protein